MSQADAWAAGASSSFTLLDFELQYSPAHEDEIIHVVGEDGALGCWNPINSVELVRAEGGEALWRPRAPVSVPSGAPVEYKYIVFRSGRLHRWEAFDGNRIVVNSPENGVLHHGLITRIQRPTHVRHAVQRSRQGHRLVSRRPWL